MENEIQKEQKIISPIINPEIGQPKSKKAFVIVTTVVLLVLAVGIAWFADYRKNNSISDEEKATIVNELTQKDEPINNLQRDAMMDQIFNSNQ
jgi:hypothetical protein